MKTRLTVLLILMLVAITSGCGTPKTDHTAVRDAYEEAIEAGDLDAALALFTDDAVILTPIGDFRGQEGIREYVEMELDFLLKGNPFGERLNVEETEDTLDYDERFPAADGGTNQLHHAYVFEKDKIKEWTLSNFQTSE
jgi:uncharacterized protein (TIGR02246 family)